MKIKFKKFFCSKEKGIHADSVKKTSSQLVVLFKAFFPSNKKEYYYYYSSSSHDIESIKKEVHHSLLIYDFSIISKATDNFADTNKLGESGFATVYKGVSVDGQEIAVKRLSKYFCQGIEVFRNEVIIAKLQHRNVIRLVGCYIDREEKIIVYEYMENKSLDLILFNKDKSMLLDWKTRYNIICGIARGLVYLHQDSIYRIIHRDLNEKNILLDNEMIPKISDFGLARMFMDDQVDAETTRTAGIPSYIAPEYATYWKFSDVFSFGVLLLEIVTGEKNKGYNYVPSPYDLLPRAWMSWREGKELELVDGAAGLINEADEIQIKRCIRVGLLCVQEKPHTRPDMATVLLHLRSAITPIIPIPEFPDMANMSYIYVVQSHR